MSIHFHQLTVKDIRQETPECVSIAFDVSPDLQDIFRFSHGQNITLRKSIGGEDIRRSYSICSSPAENELRVAVKKVSGGLFSGFANEELKTGDRVDVLPPTGKFFTHLHSAQKKKYLAFAAGSGITPVISIIKTTLAIEPESEFTLVYGNRTRSSIIFFEALEALKNKFMNRFNLIHILSRERMEAELNFGRIDVEKCSILCDKMIELDKTDEIFICGPEEMIFCIKNFLEQKEISEKKIHFELFTTSGQKKSEIRNPKSEIESGPISKITVKVDGRSFDFDLSLTSDTTILDAALKQGADLPFACKGGMCCTCKAKLAEGEVEMDVHWGLEHEEVEQGYILTCQSHPKTEKVVVDFDIK